MATTPDPSGPSDDPRESLRRALAVALRNPGVGRALHVGRQPLSLPEEEAPRPRRSGHGRVGRHRTPFREDRRKSTSPDEAFVAPRGTVESTFALCLAVRGWPLIRGPHEWEQCHRWCVIGMPEGLADKITIFYAYTRHCRFRVETPRIPGLIYPGRDEL